MSVKGDWRIFRTTTTYALRAKCLNTRHKKTHAEYRDSEKMDLLVASCCMPERVSPSAKGVVEECTWGAPRIQGELLNLGIDIGESSVTKYMVRGRKPPSQTWRTFLENHVSQLVSLHFFTVPTIRFQVFYVFLVLSHDRRRILHFNVTAHPTAECGSGNGWFRNKKGRKLFCWYNDTGEERSRVVGDASMTDAEGWLVVADLKRNQQVGKSDPKNATFGQVLQHWLEYGRTKTGEEKDASTKTTDERNARNYLSHWADHVAC